MCHNLNIYTYRAFNSLQLWSSWYTHENEYFQVKNGLKCQKHIFRLCARIRRSRNLQIGSLVSARRELSNGTLLSNFRWLDRKIEKIFFI